MGDLSPEEQQKQIVYRDARFTDKYNDIWQSVGKCVFCDLRDKYIIFEENGVVMAITLYAYIDGQCMIIPRRHIKSPKDLTQVEWETIRKFTYIAKRIIKSKYDVKGMQFIQKDGAAAASTVDEHLHFHCVPFDKPDLFQWNYRKLKYTPLENVAIYRNARKKILTTGKKYENNYERRVHVPVRCDLIIVSSKGNLLFIKRKPFAKLSPDYITWVGGRVDNFESSLEAELAREVKEELSYDLNTTDIRLLSSRIDEVSYAISSPTLNAKYSKTEKFLRNTYILEDFDESTKLAPDDDAEEIVWVPLQDVAEHPEISPSTKEITTLLL